MKRLPFTILILIAVALLLFVAHGAGTYLLLRTETFRNLINPPDSEVRIAFDSAYSIIPGTVVAKGLDVRGQHAEGLRWSVQLASASVSVDLLALLKHQVRIRHAIGDQAILRLSTGRAAAADVIAAGVRQELLDLAVAPTADSATPSAAWSVHVAGVDIQHITDIWVDEYRFLGAAFLSGGLDVSGEGKLTLAETSAGLRKGALSFTSSPAATIEDITVTASFPEMEPEAVTVEQFLAALNARVVGDAEVANIRFLNYYQQESPWIHFDGGKGRLRADVKVAQGEVEKGSSAVVEAEDLSVRLWGQTARGAGKVSVGFATDGPDEVLAVALNFAEYHVEKNGKEAITGRGLAVRVASSDRRLAAAKDDWRLNLKLPPAAVHDLNYFNAFLPKGAGLRFVKGNGSVDADLQASSKNPGDDKGRAVIATKDVEVQYGDSVFKGDVLATVLLRVADVRKAQFDVAGTAVELKNVVSTTKTDQQKDWWGKISLGKGELSLQDPVRFAGQFQMQGKDLRPLLGVLGFANKFPEWVENAIAFDGLTASGEFEADEVNLKLGGARVRSAKVALDGWFQKLADKKRGALLVKYGILTLGVRLKGDDFETKLVNAEAWFKQQQP